MMTVAKTRHLAALAGAARPGAAAESRPEAAAASKSTTPRRGEGGPASTNPGQLGQPRTRREPLLPAPPVPPLTGTLNQHALSPHADLAEGGLKATQRERSERYPVPKPPDATRHTRTDDPSEARLTSDGVGVDRRW